MPQIDFPENQKPPRALHIALLAISVACIVIVVIWHNA